MSKSEACGAGVIATSVKAVAVGGGANRQLRVVSRGGTQFSMHARHTDMALDLAWGSPDNGTTILQYPFHGGNNQLWTFDRAGGTGGEYSLRDEYS